MNHLEIVLSWSTVVFEIALCGFVFARKVQRILPFFVAYTCVLLAGTISVWVTYAYSGFGSAAAYYAYWAALLINASTRSLAIAELCRYRLRTYRGIWELTWRVLAALTALLLAHAALDAWGQPNRLAIYGMTLDRDLAVASVIVLVVLLLVRNYYGLYLEPLQRTIAAGICFFCTVDVVGNMILRSLHTGYLFSWYLTSQKALGPILKPQLERVDDLWSTIHLCSFMLAMGIWCFGLRNPLREPTEAPALLPAHVYWQMSPAINLRLRTFNDRLLEMLRP